MRLVNLFVAVLVLGSGPCFAGNPGAAGFFPEMENVRPGGPSGGLCGDIPAEIPVSTRCVEQCMYQGQMAAVGEEVIRANCRCSCAVEAGLKSLATASGSRRFPIVDFLATSEDPRLVMPLVRELKRDMVERTGSWSVVIPALGRLGDRRAVPVLVQALEEDDFDWLGREMAVQALGDIGDPRTLPVLLQAVDRADTREAALQALAKFDDPRVIEVFIAALAEEEEPELRNMAAQRLASMGREAIPALIRSFSHFEPEYPETGKRQYLCRILARSPEPSARRALVRALRDSDPVIRQCAENALMVRKK